MLSRESGKTPHSIVAATEAARTHLTDPGTDNSPSPGSSMYIATMILR